MLGDIVAFQNTEVYKSVLPHQLVMLASGYSEIFQNFQVLLPK